MALSICFYTDQVYTLAYQDHTKHLNQKAVSRVLYDQAPPVAIDNFQLKRNAPNAYQTLG
jgi:hypothetical protein